jgi:hypothetical protein
MIDSSDGRLREVRHVDLVGRSVPDRQGEKECALSRSRAVATAFFGRGSASRFIPALRSNQ